MRRPLSPLARDALALLCLWALTAAGLALMHERALADSDRHFHFAVSRDTAAQGRLTAIPQVQDIGWGTRFVDKEYLFHVLTTVGFRLGGRDGVQAVGWVLALAVVALLYAAARRFVGPGVATAAVLAFVACGSFLYRLALLRPHLWALATTVLLVLAVVARPARPSPGRAPEALAAVAGVGFTLGYHALYVPLAVLAVLAAVGGRATWRPAGFGLLGLALGTVVNPYFPDTARITWMTLRIATSLPTSDTLGVELLPLPVGELLGRYAVPLGLTLAAGMVTVRDAESPSTRLRTALVALALCFWVLTLRSARAAEYAVPLSLVAVASVLPRVPVRQAVGVLLASAALQVPLTLARAQPDALDGYTRRIEDAVAALPPEAAGQKVLHCSFTEGAFLYDLRPDVRVVDVLDPTFLALADPVKHRLRRGLLQGQAGDLEALVRQGFGARYVLCGYPPARALLDVHPRFVRLRPPPGPPLPPGSGPYLYTLRD